MQPLSPVDEGKNNHEIQYERSVATTFRNLSFGDVTATATGQTTEFDNMSGYWWTGTSATPMTLTHNLGHIPSGFLVMNKSAPCDVYQISSTKSDIVLGASTSGVSLKIFVLG